MKVSKSQLSMRLKGDKSKTFVGTMMNSMDKKLQGEYIDGLQDEIKYLEHELKLLKDKDSLQNASLNQLESFFNDGIPINENILALKNMFNSTKMDLEDKIKLNAGELDRKSKTKNEILAEIGKIKTTLNKLYRDRVESSDAFHRRQVELATELFVHRSKFEKLDLEQNELQKHLRKVGEQLHSLSRTNEKVNYAGASREEQARKEHSRVKQENEQLEQTLIKLGHVLDQLPASSEEDPRLAEVAAESLDLKRRIVNWEKEVSIQRNKNVELNFLIEQVQKERDTESEARRELERRILKLKRTINVENMMNEEEIARKASEMERLIVIELQKKQEFVNRAILHNRTQIKAFEDESNELVERKVDLQQSLSQLRTAKASMLKELAETKKSVAELEMESVGLKKANELMTRQVEPGFKEVQRHKERIVFYSKEIGRYKTELSNFQKQIELIQELRSFNFQEMVLVKNTSDNIQKNILGFIKKCEFIQSK